MHGHIPIRRSLIRVWPQFLNSYRICCFSIPNLMHICSVSRRISVQSQQRQSICSKHNRRTKGIESWLLCSPLWKNCIKTEFRPKSIECICLADLCGILSSFGKTSSQIICKKGSRWSPTGNCVQIRKLHVVVFKEKSKDISQKWLKTLTSYCHSSG